MIDYKELNALVAEKVMGWTNVKVKDEYYKSFDYVWGGFPPDYKIPDDSFSNDLMMPRSTAFMPRDDGSIPIPDYSNDIGLAWEIVNLLKTKNLNIRINTTISGEWSCFISGDKSYVWEIDLIAPLVICKAAVRIVGEDLNKLKVMNKQAKLQIKQEMIDSLQRFKSIEELNSLSEKELENLFLENCVIYG